MPPVPGFLSKDRAAAAALSFISMGGLFSPQAWATVWAYRATFLHGLSNTIQLAVVGLVLALVLGMIFGLFSTSGKKPLAALARVYVEFIQNTPLLLQMCFLYYLLAFSGNSIGILPTGMIALGVYHGAYMSEVIRAGIQSIPKGQSEAAQAQVAIWGGCTISFCPKASRSSCRPWSTRW